MKYPDLDFLTGRVRSFSKAILGDFSGNPGAPAFLLHISAETILTI